MAFLNGFLIISILQNIKRASFLFHYSLIFLNFYYYDKSITSYWKFCTACIRGYDTFQYMYSFLHLIQHCNEPKWPKWTKRSEPSTFSYQKSMPLTKIYSKMVSMKQNITKDFKYLYKILVKYSDMQLNLTIDIFCIVKMNACKHYIFSWYFILHFSLLRINWIT